jgi:hypothetical protein
VDTSELAHPGETYQNVNDLNLRLIFVKGEIKTIASDVTSDRNSFLFGSSAVERCVW